MCDKIKQPLERIELAACNASRYASQIEHLAIAAECMEDGNLPGALEVRRAITRDLLELMRELATAAQNATVDIEGEVVKAKQAA